MIRRDRVLLDSIEREKEEFDYKYLESDRIVLAKMMDRINEHCGTDIRFLAEIDAFNIPGSGIIMTQFLDKFQSESIRSYLIPQITADRVKDCARIVLSSYLHFKNSDDYISASNKPAPAQIYTRYDKAFKDLRPKKLKEDLLSLAYNPRDAFYLPFTMRMLASWKIPVLERVFSFYLDSSNITYESVGLPEQSNNYFPPLPFIRRELKFTAIEGLKHYPSESIIKLVRECMSDSDKDICSAAKKTIGYLEKHILL